MNPVHSPGHHTIRKLTLHTNAANPYQERYSLERLLQDTTLSLPGFPRRGRLLIRRLAMPYSRQNPSWQHLFHSRVNELWQKAARPRAGWVPWDAEAVFFEHEEVYLHSCIQAHAQQAWWNTQTPAQLMAQHLRVLPAVLLGLDVQVTLRWLSDLPLAVLAEGVRHLASHHLLSELPVTLEHLMHFPAEIRATVCKTVITVKQPDRKLLKVLNLLQQVIQAPSSSHIDRVQISALVLLLLSTPHLRGQARSLVSRVQKGMTHGTAETVGKVERPEVRDHDRPALNQDIPTSPPAKHSQSRFQTSETVQNKVSDGLEPLSEAFQMPRPSDDPIPDFPDLAMEDLPQVQVEPADTVNTAFPSEPFQIERIQSKYAGLLFLCNLFLHLDLITDFSDLSRRTHSLWALLGRVGLMAFEDFREDPLWTLCHTREDRPATWTPRIHLPAVLPSSWTSLLPEATPWKLDTTRFAVQHPCRVWIATGKEADFRTRYPDAQLSVEPLDHPPGQAERFFVFLKGALQHALNTEDPFHVLCQSPGSMEATASQLDVTFSLEQHPVEIRMLGLDRDPGWLPQAGLGLHFHFEVDR